MIERRLKFFFILILLSAALVVVRLFYWQTIAAERLAGMGEEQHLIEIEIPAMRGEILTNDGFPIVMNKQTYLIYAYLPQLEKSPESIANELSPILADLLYEKLASPSAENIAWDPEQRVKTLLQEKLETQDTLWVPLVRNAGGQQKDQIESLKLKGIGIEQSFAREYPEASMAASLLGFVGSDLSGNSKGYFGIEGFYDLELKGTSGILRHEKDASGKPILIGNFAERDPKDGRNLKLHLDRAIQQLVEEKLKKGLEKYQALSGEVVILDPKTGAVLSMAAFPNFDPANYKRFDSYLYKNPIVAETYEPGSTFKVLIMAAALDTDSVTQETKCDICTGPLTIGKYTIGTWDGKYRPDSTMREVIQYSDNVGMIFTSRKLGAQNLVEYLQRFGLGQKTGIDFQEEATSHLREKNDWKEIDLATVSFGQGIAVTGIQMVRAVAAIANQGILMTPQVVHEVKGTTTIEIEPKRVRRVISQDTADQITEMMVNAVENGEAKWAKPEGYKIAGKTGTSQIPVAGHYDDEKTIASFIGFAPADNPRFVMLVKLREPQSSPWGSETAAPLWFSIAKDLFFYFGIQPDRK